MKFYCINKFAIFLDWYTPNLQLNKYGNFTPPPSPPPSSPHHWKHLEQKKFAPWSLAAPYQIPEYLKILR